VYKGGGNGMISIGFGIAWPWPKTYSENQVDYIEIDKQVTKNKSVTFQFSKSMNFHTIFDFQFDTQWIGRDHGGIRLFITVGRYFLVAAFEDMRHWNWKAQRWMTDDEMRKEFEPDEDV
jgi:hypothetical protein